MTRVNNLKLLNVGRFFTLRSILIAKEKIYTFKKAI